jgi:hypothetical protein
MKSVNLIPAARLSARRRRAHAKRCIAGCSLYAVLAMAAELACRGIWGQADASLPVRLADAQAVVERSARDLAATRADMDAAQSTLRASRSIAEQPDWSVLMNLLALKEGDEIVLRQCLLLPPRRARMQPTNSANRSGYAKRPRGAASPPPGGVRWGRVMPHPSSRPWY